MLQPLGVFEFDTPLSEMTDEELEELAGEIADAMAANLETSTSWTD
jgi:hypothetical protein